MEAKHHFNHRVGFSRKSLVKGWSEIGEEAPVSQNDLKINPTGKDERMDAVSYGEGEA